MCICISALQRWVNWILLGANAGHGLLLLYFEFGCCEHTGMQEALTWQARLQTHRSTFVEKAYDAVQGDDGSVFGL